MSKATRAGTTGAVYAAAHVDFLDRDSQSITKALFYPITRVLLVNADTTFERCFTVNEDGNWTEVPA